MQNMLSCVYFQLVGNLSQQVIRNLDTNLKRFAISVGRLHDAIV